MLIEGPVALCANVVESPLRKWAYPSAEDCLARGVEPGEGVGHCPEYQHQGSGSTVVGKEGESFLISPHFS